VLHRFVSLVGIFEFHVGKPFVEMPLDRVLRHVDVLNGSVDGKDFLDVLFVDISG